MSTTPAPTVTIDVACTPETAFTVFTSDIGSWWKQLWNDADRALTLRFEPQVGGRFIEVYDAESGEGLEIGRVQLWEPGKRVMFTWRQANWEPGELTDVDVRFEPTATGTKVTLEHGGWGRVPSIAPGTSERYRHGWTMLLDSYAEKTQTH